jgi:hypothetical protein
VHHGLLVPRLVVAERRRPWFVRHWLAFARCAQFGLKQRLAEASDVAMAEDAEASGEEHVLHAITFGALRGEEAD